MKKRFARIISVVLAIGMILTAGFSAVNVSAATSTVKSEGFEDYTYSSFSLSTVTNDDGDSVKVKNNAKYFHKDMSVVDENPATGYKSLKWSYNNSTPGTASVYNSYAKLGATLTNNTPYLITFKYYVVAGNTSATTVRFTTSSGGDFGADCKIYSTSELELDSVNDAGHWTEASVAIVTDFSSSTGSMLYLNVYPALEGTATVYFDDIVVTKIPKTEVGVLFIGNGRGHSYFVPGTSDDTISFPEVTADNYYLEGWYKDTNFTTEYTKTTFGSSLDIVYAKWAKDAVTTLYFDSYGMDNAARSVIRNAKTTSEITYNGHRTLLIDATEKAMNRGNNQTFAPIGENGKPYRIENGYKYVITYKYYIDSDEASTCIVRFSCGMRDNFYGALVFTDDTENLINDDCEETRKWHTDSRYLDLTSRTEWSRGLYISVYSFSGGKLYIGEVTVTKLADNQGAVIVDTNGADDIPSYYVGTVGATYTPETPAALGARAFSMYAHEGKTGVSGITSAANTTAQLKNYGYYPVTAFKFIDGCYDMQAVFNQTNIVEDFEAYYYLHLMDIYPSYCAIDKDYEIYNANDEGKDKVNVYGGNVSLHRIGEEPYFANAVLLSNGNRLEIGQRYTMTMKVKMDKYAQTKGAIKIVSGANAYYPWSTADLGTKADGSMELGAGRRNNEYKPVVAISALTDGEWHTVSCTFESTGYFVNLQTPGYCSIYIDDVKFVKTSAAVSSNPSYTEYVQKWVENPTYTYGKDNANLSFENYPYLTKNENAASSNYSITSTHTAGTKGLLYNNKKNITDKTLDCFRLKKVEDGKTYKITFDYKITDLSANATLYFATADENSVKLNTALYTDAGMSALIPAENADGNWHTATAYISTGLTKSVDNNSLTNTENAIAKYGDMLYGYFDAPSGAKINLDNFAVTEVTSSIFLAGNSILTDEAANTAGSQAIRFGFYYYSGDGWSATFDGKTYSIIERGIVVVNGRNTAGDLNEDGTYLVKAPTKNTDKVYYKSVKTSALGDCWAVVGSNQRVFTTYIKGLKIDDARSVSARAYFLLEDNDGNEVVVYSRVTTANVNRISTKATMNSSSSSTHKFGGKAVTSFKIIVPNVASYVVTEAADQLKSYLTTYAGSNITKSTDYAVSNSSSTYEILIGDTNRTATSNVKSGLSTDAYKIYMVSNYKLVIVGDSDAATRAGVLKFISLLKDYQALNKGLVMSSGTHFDYDFVPGDNDYQLTFNDEFNGTSLDTSKWGNYVDADYTTGTSSLGGARETVGISYDGVTVNDLNGTARKALEVSGGRLNLTTIRTTQKDVMNVSIGTYRTVHWKYGFIEVKGSVPQTPACVTYWANSGTGSSDPITNKYPELARRGMIEYDFMENGGYYNTYIINWHRWITGTDTTNYSHNSFDNQCDNNWETNLNVNSSADNRATLTTQSDRVGKRYRNWADPTVKTDMGLQTDLADNDHIYSLYFNDREATACLDGKVVFRYTFTENTSTSIFRQATYLLLGCHMADPGYGYGSAFVAYEENKGTVVYRTHSVDYVRVHQRPLTDTIYD